MCKLEEFLLTVKNPNKRIDLTFTTHQQQTGIKNRGVLKSILACVELCGRQGTGLRSHRDDSTSTSNNKGNFQALLNHTARSDMDLKQHITECNRNVTYTSKTMQNGLLEFVKDYIQKQIIQAIKDQPVAGLFGIMADEVMGSGYWEQLTRVCTALHWPR